MRSGWLRCSAGLLLATAAAPVASDGWHAVPLFGADVRSLVFDPNVADRVLAGTSSGQVYESLDGGRRWQPAGQRVALPGWVVSDLEFDPHQPGRVWAALWALWGADGAVAMSDDGGRSWSRSDENLPARQVYALTLTPDRPGELFAATRSGVWGSTDAGGSWSLLTGSIGEIGKVTSLLVDPYDNNVLYAGTWRRAYRSDDRGRSWHGIFNGMVLDSEVFSLQPGPDGEGDLWASTCGWVYHGSGRGRRWQRHTNGFEERRTPSFEVLPGGRLLAGTVAGIYSSDDRGGRWQLRGPRVAVAAIAVDPRNPALVLVGSEGSGVWRSTDGGSTFVASAAGLVGLRVTDVVEANTDVAISVRYAEGADGVHHLRGAGLVLDTETVDEADDPDVAGLPTVLDLAADGSTLWAATEDGVWRRDGSDWRRLEALGEGRFDSLSVSSGWLLARRAGEILSLREGAVRRLSLDAVSDLAQWSAAGWMVAGETLWRWDPVQLGAISVATPAAVRRVAVFGGALVIDTDRGRYQRRHGSWWPLPLGADRLLPTGDVELPFLGLWRAGTATLHDAAGRQHAEWRVPFPVRDVSAALLASGRLHLATAGYGLLWSNVLQLVDDEPVRTTAQPSAAVSSR